MICVVFFFSVLTQGELRLRVILCLQKGLLSLRPLIDLCFTASSAVECVLLKGV